MAATAAGGDRAGRDHAHDSPLPRSRRGRDGHGRVAGVRAHRRDRPVRHRLLARVHRASRADRLGAFRGAHGRRRQSGGAPAPMLTFARPVLLSGLFFAGDLAFWHLADHEHDHGERHDDVVPCAGLGAAAFRRLHRRTGAEELLRRARALPWPGPPCWSGRAIPSTRRASSATSTALITSVFFGLYFLAIRVGRRQAGGGVLTLSSTIVTSALLLGVALVSGNALLPQTAQGYASLAALGLVSHAGGQGIADVGARRAVGGVLLAGDIPRRPSPPRSSAGCSSAKPWRDASCGKRVSSSPAYGSRGRAPPAARRGVDTPAMLRHKCPVRPDRREQGFRAARRR